MLLRHLLVAAFYTVGSPCYGGSRSLELYEFPILGPVVAAPRAPAGVFAVGAVAYPGVPLLPALLVPALPRHNLVRGGTKVLRPLREVAPLY